MILQVYHRRDPYRVSFLYKSTILRTDFMQNLSPFNHSYIHSDQIRWQTRYTVTIKNSGTQSSTFC